MDTTTSAARGLASIGLAFALVVGSAAVAGAAGVPAHHGDREGHHGISWDRAVGVSSPSDSTSARRPCRGLAKKCISAASAKKKAFRHARVRAKDVDVTKVDLDWDDGRLIYEIEFYKGRWEYEYDIDAKSGRVLSMDRDSIYD
jgi:uncharacterized membrane protein YkoI